MTFFEKKEGRGEESLPDYVLIEVRYPETYITEGLWDFKAKLFVHVLPLQYEGMKMNQYECTVLDFRRFRSRKGKFDHGGTGTQQILFSVLKMTLAMCVNNVY